MVTRGVRGLPSEQQLQLWQRLTQAELKRLEEAGVLVKVDLSKLTK